MAADTVSHEEYKGRCDLCDERFARDNKRLNKLEDAFEVASKLDVKLGLIVEQLQKSNDQLGKRVSTLEQKPARRWEHAVTTVLTLVLGCAVGFIFASVGLG